MNSQTERLRLDGQAGVIEALSDAPLLAPGASPRGVAIIAHPHPLFGGTMDNKVVQTLVMDWARPQVLPVTVIPGGSHFFHGQLPLLKNLVVRHLSSPV